MDTEKKTLDLYSSSKHLLPINLTASISPTLEVYLIEADISHAGFKTTIVNTLSEEDITIKYLKKGWILPAGSSMELINTGYEWIRNNVVLEDQSDDYEIIYVNASNHTKHQDGRSWCTAFSNLQCALHIASTRSESEIWVAKGIYMPTQLYTPSGVPGGASGVTTPNLFTFDIPNNTSLYGGFSANECTKKERNPLTNDTILSSICVNWHVVTLGDDIAKAGVNAKLDGFTITKGNAAGPISNDTITLPFVYAHSYGGAIYSIFGSSLVIKNCLLENNVASGIGGAIWSNNSDLKVVKCLFRSNYAGQQAGAVAVYNTYEDETHYALIKNSKFISNNTVLFGGAIVVEGTFPNRKSSCDIEFSDFEQNYAKEGGAIVVDSLKTTILNCNFTKNTSAVNGGAVATTNVVNTIAAAIQTPPVIPDFFTTTVKCCTFKENLTMGSLIIHDFLLGGPSAGIDFPLGGGALVCYINGSLEVSDSKFINNVAQNSNGGAILNGRSAIRNFGTVFFEGFAAKTNVLNCKFIGNEAVNGGAIASEPSTYPFEPPLIIAKADTVLNVVGSSFKKNIALCRGGAIYLDRTTALIYDNCFKCNKAKEGQNVYKLITSVIPAP